MKKFAVNVVILPPESVMDFAIEINKTLCKKNPSNIVLNKVNYLPHISMAMGCLREDKLDEANKILESIATNHRLQELHASHINTVKTTSGNTIATLDFEISPELAALHESIVSAFKPLLTQDAKEEDLNDLPPINPSSLEWINNFIPDACFNNFWPHITIGFGEPPSDFRPFTFRASRLAMCHLGNHCTCRSILKEALLD